MKTPVQKLSDIIELENSVEIRMQEQATSVAFGLTNSLITQGHITNYGESLNAFLHMLDSITKKMVKNGKELQQEQETNTEESDS